MGEIADDLLSGDFCQECGVFIGDGDGFPRTCDGCKGTKKYVPIIDVDKLVATLQDYGYSIKETKNINYGKQLRLNNGAIVNKFSTGKINLQGSPDEELRQILKHEGYRVK